MISLCRSMIRCSRPALRAVAGVWLACLCGIVMVACGDSRSVDYSRFVDIDPQGWENGEYCVYRLAEAGSGAFSDSSLRYDMIVTVRHNTRYPYNNLWLVMETPEGDSLASRKINLPIATPSGSWRGHGMQGLYEFSDTVVRGIPLRRSDVVTMRHDMPEAEVPGLLDIGLTIVRSR